MNAPAAAAKIGAITTILLSAQLAALLSPASAAGTVRPRTHHGWSAAFVETKKPKPKAKAKKSSKGNSAASKGSSKGFCKDAAQLAKDNKDYIDSPNVLDPGELSAQIKASRRNLHNMAKDAPDKTIAATTLQMATDYDKYDTLMASVQYNAMAPSEAGQIAIHNGLVGMQDVERLTPPVAAYVKKVCRIDLTMGTTTPTSSSAP